MENFIKIGKDKIEISEETAQNLREQFGKEGLIDETVGIIRISETSKHEKGYPVRISILEKFMQGLPKGEFGSTCEGTLPGYTMGKNYAINLRDALDRIIKKHDC